MGIRVEEYQGPDGSRPFQKWFDSLNPAAAAKVTVVAVRLSQGNLSNVKWFSGIGEYKIDAGPGYRVYLAKDGESLIILLGGGTKKSQTRDIAEAKALHEEYKARKAAAAKPAAYKKKR